MAELEKDNIISKTEQKKDSKRIQSIGKKISELSIKDIKTFEFPVNIYEATIDLKNLKSNSAKKRQVQYLGKLLREIDLSNVMLVLEQLKVGSQKEIQKNHIVENWRERLLNQNNSVTQFLNEYPDADRQLLRQTIKNAKKEKKDSSPPRSSRKLFKIIKNLF